MTKTTNDLPATLSEINNMLFPVFFNKFMKEAHDLEKHVDLFTKGKSIQKQFRTGANIEFKKVDSLSEISKKEFKKGLEITIQNGNNILASATVKGRKATFLNAV